MIYGYGRVSSVGQHLDRQISALIENGVDPDNIFQEKKSGKNMKRDELQKLLSVIGEGDIIIVSELNRISRSLQDLLQLVNYITSRGARIQSLKEPWINVDDIHGKLILNIFASLAEFERELTILRAREGIEIAKQKGTVFGRPKKKNSRIEHALQLYDSGKFSMREITEATGTARATIYRRLSERQPSH